MEDVRCCYRELINLRMAGVTDRILGGICCYLLYCITDRGQGKQFTSSFIQGCSMMQWQLAMGQSILNRYTEFTRTVTRLHFQISKAVDATKLTAERSPTINLLALGAVVSFGVFDFDFAFSSIGGLHVRTDTPLIIFQLRSCREHRRRGLGLELRGLHFDFL